MDKQKEYQEERDKIVKGLEETYKKLVEFKKQKNSPLIVMEKGQVVELNPFEVSPTTVYERIIK